VADVVAVVLHHRRRVRLKPLIDSLEHPMNKLTGSLVVCAAAASFAAAALLLNPSPTPTVAGTNTVGSSTPPVTAADGGPADAVVGHGATTASQPSVPASSSGAGAAAGSPSAATVVTIRDFSFSRAKASPGATVTVANRDGATHTVTANDNGFRSGEVKASGQGSFKAPTKAGTYRFFCEIHPAMTGELVVA
jgi:plastocyanin